MNSEGRKFHKNPDNSVKIELDDYLVIMMDGKGSEKLKKYFQITEGIWLFRIVSYKKMEGSLNYPPFFYNLMIFICPTLLT